MSADEFRTLAIEDPARTKDFEELRWFPLPAEVLAELRGAASQAPPGSMHS